MIEQTILYEIENIKKYLESKNEIGEFHPEGLGFYSYDDEIINFIDLITSNEKYIIYRKYWVR